MLNSARICAFLVVTDRDEAKTFFVETLGLKFVSEDEFALVVDSNAIRIRIGGMPDHKPQNYTVLGWEVEDIGAAVADLAAKGIQFQKYGFPGQDERGIWTAPSGDKVAWFKDPCGNVLSIAQHV